MARDYYVRQLLAGALASDHPICRFGINPLVFGYMERRLKHRMIKNRKRPVELRILWIGKTLNLSYDIVRYGIKKMVDNGIIEKWTVKLGGVNVKSISRYRRIF